MKTETQPTIARTDFKTIGETRRPDLSIKYSLLRACIGSLDAIAHCVDQALSIPIGSHPLPSLLLLDLVAYLSGMDQSLVSAPSLDLPVSLHLSWAVLFGQFSLLLWGLFEPLSHLPLTSYYLLFAASQKKECYWGAKNTLDLLAAVCVPHCCRFSRFHNTLLGRAQI